MKAKPFDPQPLQPTQSLFFGLVFERIGIGGELAQGFDGGVGTEAVVAQFAIGRLEMFGIAEMFGGVGHAELPFEEGDGVADFVDVLIGRGDGRFGDQESGISRR